MLGFVVVHGDEEHLVAADADAVDEDGRFFAGLGGVRGMRRLRRCLLGLCLSHEAIVARRAARPGGRS